MPRETHHVVPNLIPRRLLATRGSQKIHPTVVAEAELRAASVQLRVADAITNFAGSMRFVYLHIVVFAIWMLLVEKSPWPTLTLVVSLEAIFLSTFVMIGQNRQASFQQAKADHDYTSSEELLVENTELTHVIHDLTQQIHALVVAEVTAALGTDVAKKAIAEAVAKSAPAAPATPAAPGAPA